MNNTGYMVYWTEPHYGPRSRPFSAAEMSQSLVFMNELRLVEGITFVTFVAGTNKDQVGKPGVDAVVDGKTPDGHAYEWTKTHRGSGPKPV